MVTLIPTDQRTGRARRRASSSLHELSVMGSWRAPAPFAPCGTTGLFSGAKTPAVDTIGANGRTNDRPTRHLGTGST